MRELVIERLVRLYKNGYVEGAEGLFYPKRIWFTLPYVHPPSDMMVEQYRSTLQISSDEEILQALDDTLCELYR